MIHCRNCRHWVDECLDQIEAAEDTNAHIYMGCRILGLVEGKTTMENCRHYVASENLFAICTTCKTTVPKVCVSLGECFNCTDTDLVCVDNCRGGDSRKYCTHFVRLYSEGVHLIDNDRVFDLFPILGMPTREKAPSQRDEPGGPHELDSPQAPSSRKRRPKCLARRKH